jgi:hypothetical protein
MNRPTIALFCACAVLAAGCRDGGAGGAAATVHRTGFPGQISAGGGTSGQVMARSTKPKTDGSYSGGTPGHAGGMEGNTGGTATGGAVQESGKGPVGKSPDGAAAGATAPAAGGPTSPTPPK